MGEDELNKLYAKLIEINDEVVLADTKIDWSVRAIEKRFDAAQGDDLISALKMIGIRCSSNIFNTMVDNLTNRV